MPKKKPSKQPRLDVDDVSLGSNTPRKFGRLTLLKPLARGGMGEVYLAATGGIDGAERPCVVKIIRREHAADKSFLARFFDEARIQAQLQHPGIAQVLEANTDPTGKPFVVVEYVEGRNLGEIRQRASQLNAQLSWADAVAVAVALGDALAHVHERTDADGKPLEIVHRDLSPQNVMIGYAGDVKLIDFGTARGENRRCQTVSGVVFAKPGYVAPEVANRTPGGPQADIYALGIMLWELIAGRRFLSGDAAEHLAAVGAGERNPPALGALGSIPLELDTIIARLTAPALEDRYPTAREAVTDLVRLLKRAPSLADGERSVRGRIHHVMARLYPVEPARSRAEFARLLATSKEDLSHAPQALPESPHPARVNDDAELFPGTRYRVEREIASGSMSVVLQAEHVDLGRRVALKVLPREHCDNPEFETRFRREARAIAKVRHPNLVGLHDFGVSADGRPYYAMELLEGETLADYLEREGGMDWREAVDVGIETCKALEAAHETGFVHCDIKPGNIFMMRDGTLKLLDFGVARAVAEAGAASGQEGFSLMGTPEYMAPEQSRSHEVDERADVYALGAVLYELVTGQLPHTASSTLELLDKKQTTPQLPSKRAPQRGLPTSVDRLLMKALSTEPKGRFETAFDMRMALERAVLLSKRRRSRGLRTALAALTLGAIAVGVVAWAAPPDILDRARARLGDALEEMRAARVEQPGTGQPETEPEAEIAASTDGTSQSGAVLESDALTEAEDPSDEAEAAEANLDEPSADEPAGDENPEDEAKAADNADEQTKAQDPDDPISEAIARISELETKRKFISALGQYRRLARRYPDDPRVLEGWSKAAQKTKGWGESLRVALRWAALDSSESAQLHLAKTQRRVGQRYGAVATVRRFLKNNPASTQAQDLLEQYTGSRFAKR